MKTRLKEKRIEKKIKAIDLAKALNVSKQTVSNWENDKRNPNIETLCKLADLYNCSLDELVGRENKYNDINRINNIISTMPAAFWFGCALILDIIEKTLF